MSECYTCTILPLLLECEIQMTIISEANNTEHWTVKRKRKLDQQLLVRTQLCSGMECFINNLPCRIVLTRLYPRSLDFDNLVHCFKYIRDEISSFLSLAENRGQILIKSKGVFDSDERMIWEYRQEKSKFKGIRIQIYKT